MRTTKVAFVVLGLLALVGGVVLAAMAAASDSATALGMGIFGGTLIFLAVVFLLVARYMGGLDTGTVLRDGVPGIAQVLSIRDTGTIVNSVNLVVELGLQVTIPGQPAYQVKVRHVQQGRTQWGSIQPGMTVAVKVDPHDLSNVAVDPDGPDSAGAAAAAALGWGGGLPGSPGPATAAPPFTGGPLAGTPITPAQLAVGGEAAAGGTAVVPVSAADIVARGVATQGSVESAAPTGMTAGQVAAGLAPHEADDPVMQIAFTYAGPGGGQMRQQALIRVPDGKAGYLTAGAVVPVAYLPDMPQRATIDWSRLGAGPII